MTSPSVVCIPSVSPPALAQSLTNPLPPTYDILRWIHEPSSVYGLPIQDSHVPLEGCKMLWKLLQHISKDTLIVTVIVLMMLESYEREYCD